MMVELAKRFGFEKEAQQRLGRQAVCHLLLAERLEPQVVLLDRQASCHLQLGLREHPQVQLVLWLQQGGHRVSLVHLEERRAARLGAHPKAPCQQAAHLVPQGCPEVEAAYLEPKQMLISKSIKLQ